MVKLDKKLGIVYKRKPKIIKRLVLAPGDEVYISGIGTVKANPTNSGLVYIGKDLSVRADCDMDGIILEV